jgi:hypothetical protein
VIAMMSALISFLAVLRGLIRSRAALHLEVLALHHQLQVLQRSRPRRLRLARADRWLWTWLTSAWAGWRTAVVIVKPETVIAWHRQGFRLFWTWKSRRRNGRPPVAPDVRTLIRTMSQENPLWGAPRIHGELLKLGIDVSQSTVAKYMARRRRPPAQTWRTFLINHVHQIVAADFFVVPTATCGLLFVLVILAHGPTSLSCDALATLTSSPLTRANEPRPDATLFARRFPPYVSPEDARVGRVSQLEFAITTIRSFGRPMTACRTGADEVSGRHRTWSSLVGGVAQRRRITHPARGMAPDILEGDRDLRAREAPTPFSMVFRAGRVTYTSGSG